MILKDNTLSVQARLLRAALVGWSGGTLFGLIEAWTILTRNATLEGRALLGVAAAMGFVIALDGALGLIGIGLIGSIASQIGWLRRRFNDMQGWTALCVALFIALLTWLTALQQIGLFDGTVSGMRALLFIAIALVGSSGIAILGFYLTYNWLASQRESISRLFRRTLALVWTFAAFLPLAYTLLRSRLT